MNNKTTTTPISRSNPKLTLTVLEGASDPRAVSFTTNFRVGRDAECQVVLTDSAVSKVHLEVYFEKEKWWIRDLNSTNGTYSARKKITVMPLSGRNKIVLGRNGPLLIFEVEGAPLEADRTVLKSIFSPTAFIDKYLKDPNLQDGAGEQTRLVRLHVLRRDKEKARKYMIALAALGLIAILLGGYAYYKHKQVEQQELLAQNVFYEMKALDIAYASLKKRVVALQPDSLPTSETSSYLAKRKELIAAYEGLLNELGVYSATMDEKQKTIYHVARVFGECEIGMPDDFVDEVEKYVDLWKKSPRLRTAIGRAAERSYAPRIAASFAANDLPPQFFYLALQESEFDSAVVGPPTRFGIAKGMWQFVPATALAYGLKTGPLVGLARPDPRDERQNVGKSTDAAAKYISDMYNTEAQASGLLVIAGYNWGHNGVRALIRQMPGNPRERNFWKFLQQYRDKIPKQTYDYVFYIFSAAVIGENPALWGFSFDKPFPGNPTPP